MFDRLFTSISDMILRYLAHPTARYAPFFAPSLEVLRQALQPGDILVIEGNTRLSAIIKFHTQSTWSHACLYVGDQGVSDSVDDPKVLLEAEVQTGVSLVPISKYAKFNTRICRPVGLDAETRKAVVDYARNKHAQKRGGSQMTISLDETAGLAVPADSRVLELDLALGRPVLVVDSTDVDTEGKPLMTKRTRFAAERVEFVVENG